jgi:uncharacterized protein (TIGR02246 family)
VCLYAFALGWILTFTACQTASQPESKRDVAADIAAIKALDDQYAAAVNSSDAAAVAATYADDGIEMSPGQAATEGRQAIQARYELLLKENALKFAITPLETQVAGDWAYNRGNYTVTVTPKSGKPMEESGKFLEIAKRQPDGSWKVHRVIWNSNNPPAGAAGKKK